MGALRAQGSPRRAPRFPLRAEQRHGAHATLILAALALFVVLMAGCMHPGPNDPARIGPFFAPTNFAGEPSLGGLRRVVLLPCATPAISTPEVTADLDAVFLTALQRQNRFEVVTLSRDDFRQHFHRDAALSSAALPHDLLAMLQREFAADGVLFIDVTVFEPYRPLAIGLRAKLATIDGARLLWTFDEVFAASDPRVSHAARNAFLSFDHGDVPTDLTPAVLQSPSKFAAYSASAMFATLPPVNPPPAPVARH